MLSSPLNLVHPDIDADYLLAPSSTPSLSPSAYVRRTPTASSPVEPDWSPNLRSNISQSTNFSDPISQSIVSLNSPASPSFSGQSFHQSLTRSVSDGDPSFASDSTRSRSSKSLFLPDPSQFPDPYPFRPPHHHFVSPPPGLSGASPALNCLALLYANPPKILLRHPDHRATRVQEVHCSQVILFTSRQGTMKVPREE